MDELLNRFKTKYYDYKKVEVLNEDEDVEEISCNEIESENLSRPTYRNVLDSLEVFQKYIETSKESEYILEMFDNFKDNLADLKFKNLTQWSIVNYFKKLN